MNRSGDFCRGVGVKVFVCDYVWAGIGEKLWGVFSFQSQKSFGIALVVELAAKIIRRDSRRTSFIR